MPNPEREEYLQHRQHFLHGWADIFLSYVPLPLQSIEKSQEEPIGLLLLYTWTYFPKLAFTGVEVCWCHMSTQSIVASPSEQDLC